MRQILRTKKGECIMIVINGLKVMAMSTYSNICKQILNYI